MEQGLTLLIYALLFIFGAAIGSFINCLVWRQNNNMKVVNARSQCVHCGRQLSWWENIPIFSFLFLRGRCRTCKKKIPAYYFVNEFFCGVLFVFIYWTVLVHFNDSWLRFARDVVFISFLVVIFFGDMLYREIWPSVVWPAAIFGFLYNWLFLGVPASSMLIGLVVGGGFFLAQYAISRGRWIGGGDVRMGVMMGVWLGFPAIIAAIFMAYFLGGFGATLLLVSKKKKWNASAQIAFGPFLAIATIWALYHGEKSINWIMSLFG